MDLHDSFKQGEEQYYADEDKNESLSDKDNTPNKYFDVKHEEYLKQQMLHLIFNFNGRTWIDASTKESDINHVTYHYRFLTSTSYQMRACMLFDQVNRNDMNDYYNYLECGYNDDDMSWMHNKSTNKMLKIFDKNHQLMYNKGAAGFLTYFISQRDTCYIRSRFKQHSFEFNQIKYDIVGSLNYSVKKNRKFYYPLDAKCVRVDMKYRGFVLVYNREFKYTQLFYVAYFDIKGNIPQWFQALGLKSIGANYAKQFSETWEDKMKTLKQRKKVKQREQLETWLKETVGLPQYVDVFIYNGFEDLSYLNYGLCEQDLVDIGIKLKGHRMRIMCEIKKL